MATVLTYHEETDFEDMESWEQAFLQGYDEADGFNIDQEELYE